MIYQPILLVKHGLADLEMETKPEDVMAEIRHLQAIELGKG